MSDSVLDAVVIGAGPYGLSIGAHAGSAGLDVRVSGRPMDFWRRHMPAGMLLKSEAFASALSAPAAGMSYLDYSARGGTPWPDDRPVPLDTFVEYGEWFAGEAAVPIEPALVRTLVRDGALFRVELSTGQEIRAWAAVLAVGVLPFAHVPRELADPANPNVTHSSAHQDLTRFRDQDVAVVGAGQSALETTALLAEAGARPTIVARTNRLEWNARPGGGRVLRGPRSGLGSGWRTKVWSDAPGVVRGLPRATRLRIVRTTLGPAGAWWLRDRVEHRVEALLGRRVVRVTELGDDVGLVLVDRDGGRSTLVADHVIAATGYVPDVARLEMLDPALRGQLRRTSLSPALTRHFESSVPGLYFSGLAAAATFGPVMRFVYGADFAARRIVGHLADRSTGAGSSVNSRQIPAIAT